MNGSRYLKALEIGIVAAPLARVGCSDVDAAGTS
jgi:hypothetical protein